MDKPSEMAICVLWRKKKKKKTLRKIREFSQRCLSFSLEKFFQPRAKTKKKGGCDVVGDGQNIFCIQIWPVDRVPEAAEIN